jgi:transposase
MRLLWGLETGAALWQKNDFRDGEAIAEAVQRPTMRFVATKTVEQLDLQALHRVRERLVGQRTGICRAPTRRREFD